MRKIVHILLLVVALHSCGTTKKPISVGSDARTGMTFKINQTINNCCGCYGIEIVTFQTGKVDSKLQYGVDRACPFFPIKRTFKELKRGKLETIDTWIAVSDSTFEYPLTSIDSIALSTIDSILSNRGDSKLVAASLKFTGYRTITNRDREGEKRLPEF